MSVNKKTTASTTERQHLLLLCRFLALRLSYRFMLLLLSVTGVVLTLLRQTQFAPYGIALICLLLPSFLGDSIQARIKEENSELPLSVLFRRYRYSPSFFTGYRITSFVCMLLLLVWHKVRTTPLILFGASLPLLYLALYLALSTLLSRVLFFFFHRRLMNGTL